MGPGATEGAGAEAQAEAGAGAEAQAGAPRGTIVGEGAVAGTGAGAVAGVGQWFTKSSHVDAFMTSTITKKRRLEVLKEQLTHLSQQHKIPRTAFSENGKKLKPEELANRLKRKLEQVFPTPATIASTTKEAPHTAASGPDTEETQTTAASTPATMSPTPPEATAKSTVTVCDLSVGGTESGGTHEQQQVTQQQTITEHRPREAGPPSCPARGIFPVDHPPHPGSPSHRTTPAARQQARSLAAEEGSVRSSTPPLEWNYTSAPYMLFMFMLFIF